MLLSSIRSSIHFSIRMGMWLTLTLFLWGCGAKTPDDSAHPMHSPDRSAERLLPAAAMKDDVLLRQRVTIRWDDGEQRFDSVFQKRGATMTLMGLGPMNRVGFILSLADRQVAFENRSGRDMPFAPEHILADVQRVFYPWLAEDSKCLACQRTGIRMGQEIEEKIGARFLEERRFRLVDHPGGGEVIIRYADWEAVPESRSPKEFPTHARSDVIRVPKRVVVTNEWFGYELVVETMSVERIAVESTP